MPTQKTSEKKSQKEQSYKKTNNFQHLHRSATDKVIAGICGGLGEYFGIDPTLIRIIFILATVFGGSGILIYLLLWIIFPSDNIHTNFSEENLRKNIREMKETAQKFASEIRVNKSPDNTKSWGALLIIILGLIFLLDNFGYNLNLGKLWPILLIFLGFTLLMRKK